jgi:hypothetical protein
MLVKIKFLFWFLVLLSVSSLIFSGCGGGGPDNTSAVQPPSSAIQASSNPVPARSAQGNTPATGSAAKPGGAANSSDSELNDLMAKSQNVPGIKYQMESSGINMVCYQKKNKFRSESSTLGMDIVTIVDYDNKAMYTYYPRKNQATKANSPAQTTDTGAMWKYKMEKLGTETLDGKACTVVSYTIDSSKVKCWLSKDYGVPLKIDMGGLVIAYKDLEVMDVPDDMFVLPSGVEIVEYVDPLSDSSSGASAGFDLKKVPVYPGAVKSNEAWAVGALNYLTDVKKFKDVVNFYLKEIPKIGLTIDTEFSSKEINIEQGYRIQTFIGGDPGKMGPTFNIFKFFGDESKLRIEIAP